MNFDGSNNNISIVGHIFSVELSNKIYTLKEMMKQPDKDDFANVMHTEVKHMFDNEVGEKVPRKKCLIAVLS
eukprot:347702-Ditylum_brightwellii.AAC.1